MREGNSRRAIIARLHGDTRGLKHMMELAREEQRYGRPARRRKQLGEASTYENDPDDDGPG